MTDPHNTPAASAAAAPTIHANPEARSWRTEHAPEVIDFHRSIPGYAPTRLIEVPALAHAWPRHEAVAQMRLHELGSAVFESALWIAPSPVGVSRAFACGLLREERIEPARRAILLAGRPGRDRPDAGALVCSCLSVGRLDVERAVRAGAHDVAAIGRETKAGTNCGSCRSELKEIVDAVLARDAR